MIGRGGVGIGSGLGGPAGGGGVGIGSGPGGGVGPDGCKRMESSPFLPAPNCADHARQFNRRYQAVAQGGAMSYFDIHA
jgi:hypothetical protein